MNKFILILIVISIGMTMYFYNNLPEKVPMQYNFNGEVTKYADKPFVWITALLPIFILILKYILPKIDPHKENYKKHDKAFNVTMYTIIIFLISVHLLSLYTMLGNTFDMARFTSIGVGLLFMVLGNLFPQIRHNYFFGIRTPWTLASEECWKRTHRIGGYGFVITGILFIILGFFKSIYSQFIFLGLIISLVAYIIIYSYIIFNHEEYKQKK